MITALILLSCCFTADPTTTASDDLKLEVRRLIRQLDADQLADRDSAEKTLLDKGPSILEVLPETDDRTTPEVRLRLARIRQKLHQTQAESSIQASRITLEGEMPLSQAIAALSKQSGNPISDYRTHFRQEVEDPKVKVHFKSTPFWQALDQTLEQAGMALYPFGEEPGLNIVAQQKSRGSFGSDIAYSGSFRFQPVQTTVTRDLRRDSSSLLRVVVETTWEPRLKPIALKLRAQDLIAVDDRGNRLSPDTESDLEIPLDGDRAAVSLELPLLSPPREAQSIATLKGMVSAIIPGKVQKFSFDNLPKAKNVSQQIAHATITFEEMQKNNESWEVRLRVKFDNAGDALASYRGWIFQNEAYLEGPDGKPIPFDAFETTRQGKDDIGLTYLFSLEEEPTKLKFIYKTPASLFSPTFDFELKNIKLP